MVNEPSFKEITEVVKIARTGSAPGPNGIHYKEYKMSKAFTQTMEPSKGDKEKRQSPRVLATGRRNIYTQGEGIETCDRLPNNLFAERRGENILCCTRKTYDNIPNSKSVQRHISTE